MPNPLEQAVKSATRANDRIGESFARFGTAEHPRGFVLSAYRNAHRAMLSALKEDNRLVAVLDVTAGLRLTLQSSIRAELEDMQAFGQDEAARQLGYYGVEPPPDPLGSRTQGRAEREAAMAAIMAGYDAQSALVSALVVSGAEDGQIVGDDSRAGVLVPSVVIAAAVYWAANLTWTSFSQTAQSQSAYKFKKQAVAGLDERTTDCCLRVHAQVREIDDPFDLYGTPRYADKMDWPAFHYYCRTSGTLYLPEFDDGVTVSMRLGADQILRERAAGGTGFRHPADAFA